MSATHPLWRPYHRPSDEEIQQARVRPHVREAVEVVAYDPAWPAAYEQIRKTIVAALGGRLLAVEHVGSTAVPGLAAKAVIDVDVTVSDSSEESAWLPDLERAGLELRVREPEWEEHRCLRIHAPRGNVHVWSPGSAEAQRHVLFRDWLRSHEDDRVLYAAAKEQVAAQGFSDSMLYNNAKGGVIYDLYERIFAADPAHQHDGVRRAP